MGGNHDKPVIQKLRQFILKLRKALCVWHWMMLSSFF